MKQLTPADAATTKLIPVDKLVEHPRNVRRGDVDAIVESLETHGQYRPLIIQKSTMHVCAGNHTLRAIRRLEWDKVACTVLDVDDEQALRILLADNATADKATYDYDALGDVLAELAGTGSGLAGSAYSTDDLDDILAQLEEAAPKPGDVTKKPQITDDTGNQYASKNLVEYADHYREIAVRSIVLHYTGDQFLWVTDRLADVRTELDVESNTDAIMALLAERYPDEPIPEIEAEDA